MLAKDFDIESDVWSVTSFNELRKEAALIEREERLNPSNAKKLSHVSHCLGKATKPVIAATDYMRLYADQIREYVPTRYVTLGTDGFGRSDTRARLRHFFEVDAKFIVVSALKALADEGDIKVSVVDKAIKQYGIDSNKHAPLLS